MQKLFLHALLLCSAILTYQYLTDESANAQEFKFERVPIAKTNYLAQQSQLDDSDRLTKTNNYISQKTPASIFFQQQKDRDFVSSQSKVNNGQQTTDNGRDAIYRVSTDDRHVGAMAQVTSVSQLSDVQPTDWAFLALQSLVERYGCIAGYPDSSFRGNRALTRYEFAAGLNACLERVNELIATTGDRFDRKDLVTLQRLQEEFAAELSTLRGRVDVLEAQTAQLQANQFSTTTKLTGLAWGNVTGASAGGRVKLEAVDLSPPARFGGVVARRAGRDAATGRPAVQRKTDDPSITFSDRVWLNFNTSFSGKDSLVVQLAAGNGDSPANQFTSSGLYNTYGVPFFDQTAGIQGLGNDVILRELSYTFPVGDFEVVFGPRINWYRYFDNNAFTFILTGANSFNSNGSTLLNAIDRGSGAAVVWKPSQQLRFAVGYIGENTEFLSSSIAPGYNTASDPDFGLFGGTYTATAELTFSPSDRLNLRLLYNRSRLQQINGVIGGATGEPIYGIADNGVSAVFNPATDSVANGGLDSSTADTYEFNFDWLITRGLGIFGRYTYGSTHLKPIDEDINAQAVQAGIAFPDLGKEGALLTFSYVIPFSILDGRNFLVSGGGNGGVQYEFEANYYFPLTDNIALVPAFYLIANPNNFSDNPTIYVGNLRAQLSF